jgi:hypothetical protein
MDRDIHVAPVKMGSISAFTIPSIGNIVFVSVFFVLIFGSGNGLLGDGDTGYHIRTGEGILQTWQVPGRDPYSFHSPPLRWTAHEWLSELVMAAVYKTAGLTGVVVSFALLLAVTHWLLYRLLTRRFDDVLLGTVITLLATATSAMHWLARPHAFSLLLTLLWCHYLDQFNCGGRRSLLHLPLLMLFWVNLHGGYIIGLILIILYLLGDIFYSITLPPEQSRQFRRKARVLFGILMLCVAACLMNPYGAEILWFPIRVASDRFVMDRVSEFMSPNFHEALPFKYMLLAVIGALALSRSALSVIDMGLVILLSYMSLYSARHVSLFAIILAPVLLKTCLGIIDRAPATVLTFYRKRNLNLKSIETALNGYTWPIASVIFVAGIAAAGGLNIRFNDKIFPVAGVEFLKREPVSGNMFNNDEFGDYMIFTAWPQYRVFMDGRSDMYGRQYGGDYLRVVNLQPGWRQILKKYDISWVFFDTTSALSAALQEDQDWQPIYSDAVSTVFVKKDKLHAYLLAKYPSVKLATK